MKVFPKRQFFDLLGRGVCCCLFICLLTCEYLVAQAEVLKLSSSDFSSNQIITLTTRSNWVFKIGDNPEWANPALDTKGWDQRHLYGLRTTQLDEDRNLEGWFRLKFEIDSSLSGTPLSFLLDNFGQALELYLDGNLIYTLGNTGRNGGAFQVSKVNQSQNFIPTTLKANHTYTIAIYYVHRSLGFPVDLIVNRETLWFGLALLNSEGVSSFHKNKQRRQNTSLFITTVIFVISLLFWLIFIQNPKEKTLRLITIACTLLFIASFSEYSSSGDFSLNFQQNVILGTVMLACIASVLFYFILILSNIFLDRDPKRKWLILILAIVCFLEMRFIQTTMLGLPIFSTFLLLALYYVIKAWKNAKGAQWAIIIGVLATLSLILTAVLSFFSNVDINENFARAMFLLFLPLSLLVYVSMRFKEIIVEVRGNAQRLIVVTEEKRQQALQQKAKLEEEVKSRTADLSESLENLKATQTQLVQQEKLASLGQLTAGIAHEIKNPLNFVNNFSEVSKELLEELREAIEKSDWEEVKSLAKDIEQNLDKIHQHGSRADSIVKSMLLHSRGGSGIPEPSDLNELIAEYVNLAFHGMRASKKPMNVSIDLQLEENIDQIPLIKEDFSRVILNLVNNAFDAMRDQTIKDPEYQPKLQVTTQTQGEKVLIVVGDNGPGIPKEIVNKILQPFFTTKKGTAGTGLGLSISHDIIKALKGELLIESTPGAGTSFKILLPKKT